MNMNRLVNINNPYQGSIKKVLCVCSAGLLRSPTAAVVLSQEPFNYNTRAAGLSAEYALIYADDALLLWADEVVCMDNTQSQEIEARLNKLGRDSTPILSLNIPDNFEYRNPQLIGLIKDTYTNFISLTRSG